MKKKDFRHSDPVLFGVYRERIMFYCFSCFFATERRGQEMKKYIYRGKKVEVSIIKKKKATQILGISHFFSYFLKKYYLVWIWVMLTQPKIKTWENFSLAKWIVFHSNHTLSHSILLLGMFGRWWISLSAVPHDSDKNNKIQFMPMRTHLFFH